MSEQACVFFTLNKAEIIKLKLRIQDRLGKVPELEQIVFLDEIRVQVPNELIPRVRTIIEQIRRKDLTIVKD